MWQEVPAAFAWSSNLWDTIRKSRRTSRACRGWLARNNKVTQLLLKPPFLPFAPQSSGPWSDLRAWLICDYPGSNHQETWEETSEGVCKPSTRPVWKSTCQSSSIAGIYWVLTMCQALCQEVHMHQLIYLHSNPNPNLTDEETENHPG